MYTELIDELDKHIVALVNARAAVTGEETVMYRDFMIGPIQPIQLDPPEAFFRPDETTIVSAPEKKPGRRAFTTEQREAQRKRMKEYWANRKRATTPRKRK